MPCSCAVLPLCLSSRRLRGPRFLLGVGSLPCVGCCCLPPCSLLCFHVSRRLRGPCVFLGVGSALQGGAHHQGARRRVHWRGVAPHGEQQGGHMRLGRAHQILGLSQAAAARLNGVLLLLLCSGVCRLGFPAEVGCCCGRAVLYSNSGTSRMPDSAAASVEPCVNVFGGRFRRVSCAQFMLRGVGESPFTSSAATTLGLLEGAQGGAATMFKRHHFKVLCVRCCTLCLGPSVPCSSKSCHCQLPAILKFLYVVTS